MTIERETFDPGQKVRVVMASSDPRLHNKIGWVEMFRPREEGDTLVGRIVHVRLDVGVRVFHLDHGDRLVKEELSSEEQQLINMKAEGWTDVRNGGIQEGYDRERADPAPDGGV